MRFWRPKSQASTASEGAALAPDLGDGEIKGPHAYYRGIDCYCRDCVGRAAREPREYCANKSSCKGSYPHRACSECGKPTCGYLMRVEPGTLRRRKVPVCDGCSSSPAVLFRDEDERSARTHRDWLYSTDPVVIEKIRLGILPEQFPSHVRAALRAFYESHQASAVVDLASVTPGSLNQSIASLGLQDQMYAEQRSGQTVLRRLQASTHEQPTTERETA